MAGEEGAVCLYSFLGGMSLIVIQLLHSFLDLPWIYYWMLVLVYVVLANVCILFMYPDFYDVSVRGLGLGLVFSLGVTLTLSTNTFRLFGWYIAAITFFHWSEYFTTAKTNPKNLSIQSYLLDHSTEYHLAAAASFLEFSIEWYFLPAYKTPNFISIIGLIIVSAGEFLRKLSMYTAATNFNHYVQYAKSEDHTLVTHGVYSYFRHPAYVGWFYWSLGTQLMICNPICLLCYAYAAWKFFASRIYDEELALVYFFKEEYLQYQEKVPTGIPFIKGYEYHG